MSSTKAPAQDSKYLLEELTELRHRKRAILLGHYYANPEVQDVCDYVGDSLGLSREAAKSEADIVAYILWQRRLLFWRRTRKYSYPP